MKEYKSYLANLVENNKNELFFNSDANHAAVVMGTLFSNAINSVKIFAANFSGEVSNSNEYRKGLERFLRKGGNLKILLQQDKLDAMTEEPALFDLLRFYAYSRPEQITIKKHPFKLKKKVGSTEIHFCVADDKMYRMEDDVENFAATGNFNDPDVAKKLSLVFDELFIKPESKIIELTKMTVEVG